MERELRCATVHGPWNPINSSIVKRYPVNNVDAELLTAREIIKLLESFGLELLSTCYFLYLREHHSVV
jgi:hypothetical protein